MENIDFMDFESLYPSKMMSVDDVIECLEDCISFKNNIYHISYQYLVNKIKKMQKQRKNELFGKVGVSKNGK